MNDVMRILKDDSVTQLAQTFGNDCRIEFSVRKLLAGKIYEKLALIKDVNVSYLRTV